MVQNDSRRKRFRYREGVIVAGNVRIVMDPKSNTIVIEAPRGVDVYLAQKEQKRVSLTSEDNLIG